MNEINTDIKSVPNAARIYDYLLGGHHNFEADRQAAEYMLTLVPSSRKWIRHLRSFLHQSVQRLAEEGFDRFLDLASGLPTAEHIHTTVPQANVIYVDNDPLVVASGAEILGDHPSAKYIEADIRSISDILASTTVKETIGDDRKVAIGLNAVTCFLKDDELRKIVETLFEWAPKGSKMYATFETKNPDLITPSMQQFVDMFERVGSPYYFLTLEKSKSLMKPWTADNLGFLPITEALGLSGDITEIDREGVDLEFYGAILTK